jgi:hypothetical protein
VWSRYEIIWVKGQTRIFQKKNDPTLAISFLRAFFVIFIQKTAEVVEKLSRSITPYNFTGVNVP